MPLAKFQFKPGFDREGTAYDTEGGWFDGNLIRFNRGRPQKIGGWRKDTSESFVGTCRALHAWVGLNGTKYLGLGTTNKYYIEDGSSYFDITPIRLTTSANEISFAATAASAPPHSHCTRSDRRALVFFVPDDALGLWPDPQRRGSTKGRPL